MESRKLKRGSYILVLAKDFSIARMHLLNMVHDMKHGDIKEIRNTSHELYVELKNGDTYQALCIAENLRGHKFDKVYVNAEIDLDTFIKIIKPMLVMSKLPENEQIVIY